MIVPVTINTAANATFTTDQVLGGMILRDGNGGARTDTLPSAAALADAIQGAMVGTSLELHVRNATATAAAVTLAAGAGGTTSGTMAVAQLNSNDFLIVFTNVTIGQEAYTVYSKGGGVF
jgi:hypothetical protein